MNPHDETQDEAQIASLLAATESDAAPPDAALLARLRTESAAAFAASSPMPRRRPMIIRTATWLAAAAAIALACAGGYYLWELSSVPYSATLAEVIDNSEQADSVHLRFTSGKEVEFWHTRAPARSRWDDRAGHYSVADGAKYWIVNEAANEARRSHPPEGADRPLHHFVALLGFDGFQAKLLHARPVERRRDGSRDVLVYRGAEQSLNFEAFVDAATHRLYRLRTVRGELTVIGYDEPIGEEKFAIAGTLTDDGRIGTVADVQGIVTIRPALAQRWTPVRQHLVLRPGDWVRTDARGANATALRLAKQTGIVLGPKSLVELVGPTQIRLIEGEIEISPGAGAAIEVVGPGGIKAKVKAKQLYQARNGQLLGLAKEPAWLLGFKGATTNNVLGSLVALVDGRNEPLSVGYHKVTVDIRDQIARTVIEESFVNHTDTRLEGIFNFPLPPDASISGFGMWIGNQLVEADVVEKQRAREIYETFLRERRDPALLEWSGGNIFKARVFPILAHSEKRIKITYTQVLPLKGNRYRYSYALVSDMLRQHPLRELNIDVKVNSAVALKGVTCPTHETREDKTERSAHVEFTAQEYTPTRDFEVVVEVAKQQSSAVLIPHRRGDDGYFMLQITPPAHAGGSPQRALLPDGDPVQLLILADTSASIDAGQRATQATFIGTLLASLAPKDTFNLATCDVGCDWAFPKYMPADNANVATARDFLAKRTALGWTNLDGAFAAALKRAGSKTQIIYVGDGIVTTGDGDPVAFAKRLRKLHHGSTATLHAVSLGSSYEAGVLKTIASLGGGSLRKITSEQGPQQVAQELLGEIAVPALRDIHVEFKGIQVARLYPETVANVPAGTQQILLGRYLPLTPPPLPPGERGRGEGDQTGEVIVTGTQGGKAVRFSTRVALKDAEHGNSFIPRLWSRMHLDTLLEQGASEVVRDEIIALSEEYSIITPYTSLLVLETDADRERFKVTRRFRMRDGERFFAKGRDNAVFDLTQKQMKRAGAWRTALRRAVLSDLARFGRNPRLFVPRSPYQYRRSAGLAGQYLPQSSAEFAGDALTEGFDDASKLGVVPLGDLGRPADRELFTDGTSNTIALPEREINEFPREEAGIPRIPAMEPPGGLPPFDLPTMLPAPLAFGGEALEVNGKVFSDKSMIGNKFGLPGFDGSDRQQFFLSDPQVGGFGGGMGMGGGMMGMMTGVTSPPVGGPVAAGMMGSYTYGDGYFGRAARIPGGPDYRHWLNTLFPPLPTASAKAKQRKSTWPAAARELARSLLRTDRLAKLTGGIEIANTSESFNPRWGVVAGRTRRLDLVGAKRWLARAGSDGGQTLVSWYDGKEVGVFSTAFQLGRLRAATPLDVGSPLEPADFSTKALDQIYWDYAAAVEPAGKDRAVLVLKSPTDPDQVSRITIDTARHVIVSMEERTRNKVRETVTLSDFVEAAGMWWACRMETTDADGKRVMLSTQTVKPLTPNELDGRIKTELAGQAQVQFVHVPLPSALAARKALAAGKGTFDDAFLMLLHFHSSQQWSRVLDHEKQAEKLAAGKAGVRWLRWAILNDSRRHEELRHAYRDEAVRLGKETSSDAYFLADYIVRQSAGVLQANEMLALLDVLRPLYDKQPGHVQAGKAWQELRVAYLNQAGRTDDALRLRKQLATDYPRDVSVQHQYAHALANAGDHPAAYAWLTRALGKDAKWREEEAESLRNLHAQLLEQEGRFAELVKYLAAWTEENPTRTAAYQQYLTALIKTDQIDTAEALALRWLKEAQVPGTLAPPAEARLSTAITLLHGSGYQISTGRIEERWLLPLANAALYFIRHPTQAATAEEIVANGQFQSSDEGRLVRKAFAKYLADDIVTLPGEQVQRLLRLAHTDDLEPAAWQKIAATLRQRWTAERDDNVKNVLGTALVDVLAKHGGPNEPLAFLRLRREKGPERYRTAYTNYLFNYLTGLPWTAEHEAEAFTLFDKLSDAGDEDARLFTAVATLHGLTDKLLASRYQARMKAVEHPEKLTRTELQKKQSESWRQAREELADRLRKEAARHPKALAQWLIAESVYLDLTLDRRLKEATATAWEVVGAVPAKSEHALDDVLRLRYITTLMNLAARKGAEPTLIDRLMKYFDAGIRSEADAARWKFAKYRLLVVLDRPKELERALTAWTKQDDADSRWRIALGYLLAEQGRVAEAIRAFETVEAANELTPAAYRSLADWYLVENRRDDHERAARAVYRTMPEYYLQQMLAYRLQPWQQPGGHLPSELDAEVLRMFAVLFDKSAAPQNYLYHLQQYYDATHDFRLLAVLADAVVGHTAARVYPFVQSMQSVLNEVRDEATADEMVKRIGEVRPRAKTVVDQRALDMLEVLVERRAAELQNQPGPHRDRALAALVRAGKRAWSPGEPRLMADFLAGLGRITQTPLAKEQLRQLQALHAAAVRGTQDRLHVAQQHAMTLNGYDRRSDAIDLLQAALDEFQQANEGILPVSANGALAALVGLLEDGSHFARGEKLLVDQLRHPIHAQQRRWLIEQLDGLYHQALHRDAEVSLGKGLALYQALDAKLRKDMLDNDPNHRWQLISQLCGVYRTAHAQKRPDVLTDLKRFAYEVLPPMLPVLRNQHAQVVSTTALTLHDVAGADAGVAYLVHQLETEPRWLRYTGQDGWNQHGWSLAQWRTEAKNLGDVENRLLRLVLAELRRDLESRSQRSRAMYSQQHAHFWREKAADFARVAEEVLPARSHSGPAVLYIADYLYRGLGQANRAIEVLFIAHKQQLLDEAGQVILVEFLHRESRYADSIPLLGPLVERRPENLEYRVQLMRSYFRTNQKAKLLALLKDTDTFFHAKDRWTEPVMARLAESTLENELYEQSVAYYKEVIPLHERSQPGRGVGNTMPGGYGTLSGYYTGLANAYAGLNKTAEAVDAAGAAIVSWGPHYVQRAQALETLKQVLMRSRDLDGFVAHFDKQKQDSVLVRKTLGEAYSAKGEHAKAIQQLEKAAQLQPNDPAIHQALIAILDKTGDKEGALRHLLQAVQLARRDLNLYEDLGKRYTAAGQPEEAERAYTSIVEVQPAEAESHALLAEVREKQGRWAEAIEQWQQAARLRALEPTALLRLAAAQIHERRWDAAGESLRRLEQRTWPPRFGDVQQQVRILRDRLKQQQ